MDGMRLVVSNEMGEGQIDEPLLKKLTGGDTITFEEKYVNPWQNSATFTIFMAGNDVPKALAESEALWNRWRQVPLVDKIPNADPKWLETVKREPAMRSAVLAWAVRGRAGWNTYGIGNAPAVAQATEELRLDMDPLRVFWEDHCIFGNGDGMWTASDTLGQAYGDWCYARNEHPINAKAFGRLLRNKGCESKHKRTSSGAVQRGWAGIKLRGAR